MRKILLVTTIYPPQIGGPATFIQQFARYLAQKGHKVTVICISEKKYPAIDQVENFSIYRITPGYFRITFHLRKWLSLLWFVFKSEKVLINGIENEAAKVCTYLKKPYILKIVGDWAWEFARNSALTTLDIDEFQTAVLKDQRLIAIRKQMNQYVHNAAYVYVPSKYLKGIVKGWGKPDDKIVVINNGVAINEERQLSVFPREKFRILFVGRITNWKGVEMLLVAVKDLKDVEVNICGDGPALNYCIELNRRLNNKHVHFLGRVSHSDITTFIQETDVLVLPSLYEGLSHTILEAMAYGKPCIASNIGGNPELIEHGVNGLLFDPYNVNDLTTQILAIKADDYLKAEFSLNSLSKIKSYSTANVYNQVEQLLC